MIKQFLFPQTTGLLEEMKTLTVMYNEKQLKAELDLDSREKFIKYVESTPHYMDFVYTIAMLKEKQGILDVGAGVGYTSIYASLKGHNVTAVEPSSDHINIMLKMATTLNVKLDIWQTIGEYMPVSTESKFNHIVFHSSLHHCDNPQVALKNAYGHLTNRGQVFLISEPVLQCFRSKKWYFDMLKNYPERMGHYGGNEHVYRVHEYEKMLYQAGFHNVCITPSAMYQMEPHFRESLPKLHRFIKNSFYFTVKKLVFSKNFRPLTWLYLPLLKKGSMLQFKFSAQK